MTTKGSFKVDIYNCDVHIVVTDNIRRSINYYLRKGNHEVLPEGDEPGAYCFSDTCTDYYVFFNRKTIDVSYVNHEKSHLVESILEDRGINPKDETRAYLDGFLSEKIDAFFKRRKIKVK